MLWTWWDPDIRVLRWDESQHLWQTDIWTFHTQKIAQISRKIIFIIQTPYGEKNHSQWKIWQPQLSMNESFWIPISSIVATIKIPNHFFSPSQSRPGWPLSYARTEFYTTGGMLLLARWIWNRDTAGDTKKRNNSKKWVSVMIVTRREWKWSEISFSSLWKNISGHCYVPLELGGGGARVGTLWAFNN